MPGESIVSPAATAPATGKLFVSIYNNEQHFAYMDGNGNVQDVWWDGNANRWNRQQITNAGGKGASVPGEFIAAPVATAAASGHLVVSVDDNEQHFAYMDGNGNVQDVWYDGRQWHLQQLNNAGGKGASVPGEFVASPGPAEGYLLSASVH